MNYVKIKRTWCQIMHRRHYRPTNGFGWRGLRCSKCGYTFFSEWEEGFKGKTLFCDD